MIVILVFVAHAVLYLYLIKLFSVSNDSWYLENISDHVCSTSYI